MRLNFCSMCGVIDNLQFHHVVPKSRGGSDDDSNILTVCGKCHAVIHQASCEWNHSKLTKDALSKKKINLERTGSIPYGYKLNADGVSLDLDNYEMDMISCILKLKDDGKSYRTIIRIVNSKFSENKRKINGAQTISNIIKRYGIDYQ